MNIFCTKIVKDIKKSPLFPLLELFECILNISGVTNVDFSGIKDLKALGDVDWKEHLVQYVHSVYQ